MSEVGVNADNILRDLQRRVADLEDRLSPPDATIAKPPTLREKVAQALLDVPHGWPVDPEADRALAHHYADAVLAVIADEADALDVEFDADVALSILRKRLRGEQP